MPLSEDQILALAPDEASKKSGKDLSNPAKWVSRGASENALWGECQGSGSKPYQTQIDLSNIAFKCSCPSRKFPCKHGLGLMLYHVKKQSDFTNKQEPAWVTDWLAKRIQKEEKKSSAEDKPADEAAQAKRRQARQAKVEDGVEELRLWLKDIVRNGILSMPEKQASYFENMVKRMVDAQATGLANMVRLLGETNFFEDGWQSVFMQRLLDIFLLTEAFRNINSLPENVQEDTRAKIGFTQNLEALKEQTGITDTWMILAKQVTEQDSITTERYWLYGASCRQYALVLQFIVRGQGAQLSLSPGMFIQAELVFFTAAFPLRAIIKKQISINPAEVFSFFENWNEVANAETGFFSLMPVRGEMPYLVKQLKPVFEEGQWWLQDTEQKTMNLTRAEKKIWTILSLSGGEPVDMAVVGKGNKYEPVGIWYRGQYKII